MRRFFITVFALSLIATAGAWYWRTYLPEKTVTETASKSNRNFQTYSEKPGAADPQAQSFQDIAKAPSERQNLAVTISIVSSIISALAAVLQTWLTARAYRR